MMEVNDDSELNLMRLYSTFAEISQALTLLEENKYDKWRNLVGWWVVLTLKYMYVEGSIATMSTLPQNVLFIFKGLHQLEA